MLNPRIVGKPLRLCLPIQCHVALEFTGIRAPPLLVCIAWYLAQSQPGIIAVSTTPLTLFPRLAF